MCMKLKMTFLVLAMLFLSDNAWLQNVESTYKSVQSSSHDIVILKGHVISKGRGVPYASLQLIATGSKRMHMDSCSASHFSIGVICNDVGEYEFRIPSGHEHDTVLVRSMGYVSYKTTVARLLRYGNVRLESHSIELKIVTVTSYRTSLQLLNDVVKHIGRNYQQHTAWSTFFYRDWRTVDGELYLFDEAVMSFRRSSYSQYADKRSYRLDPSQREMESNIKTLLRHRLVVYDRKLLETKIIRSAGCDQMLSYVDDEDFFDPVATPQASYALANRMLKEHEFESLKEFSTDGEEYYIVCSMGPNRRPGVRVRYEYTIRKRDLAIVRLVSSQQPSRRRAPNDAWVNWYFNSLVIDADSSVWTYEVRDGHYTLTRYYNSKSYHLESRNRSRIGKVQRWQQCHDWVLTDFSLCPVEVEEKPLSVTPQTIAGAFGRSDYSSDFWGQYNWVPIDVLPLRLLNEKIYKP